VAKEFSLLPVQKRLSELLSKTILFADDCIGNDAVKAHGLKPGELLLLENLRFMLRRKKTKACTKACPARRRIYQRCLCRIAPRPCFGGSHYRFVRVRRRLPP
jgi:3-phosphoglycerate kinase